MNEPQVRLSLEGDRAAFCPGEVLRGTWSIERLAPTELKAIELSVLWHTEGKGDEDLAVHFFERVTAEDSLALATSQPRVFSVPLPSSPMSYDGLVVKIRWCVRVRVFLHRGRELLVDVPFRLGEVPSPRASLPRLDQTAVEAVNGDGEQ
ncbi:MAG: hypothetical protein HY000_28400 [Planctomycetes bacterium]|nr:hypothetical protein [Planctomycetota bacterium]